MDEELIIADLDYEDCQGRATLDLVEKRGVSKTPWVTGVSIVDDVYIFLGFTIRGFPEIGAPPNHPC